MKHFLKVLLLLSGYCCYSQSDYGNVEFRYDIAGNQIKRQLICVNCDTPLRMANPGPVTAMDSVTDQDLTKSLEYKNVSYYPNPVLEQLYVKWNNDQNLYVNAIEVYSMAGQIVVSKENLKDQDHSIVEFQKMAQGIYNVILVYSNGERKDLKVIKK